MSFSHVQWSGLNQFFARAKGERRLEECLFKAMADAPDAHIVVIAHSHGGNIAYRVWLSNRKFSLVTLATPFIITYWPAHGGIPSVGVVIGTTIWTVILTFLILKDILEEWGSSALAHALLGDGSISRAIQQPLVIALFALCGGLLIGQLIGRVLEALLRRVPTPSEEVHEFVDSRGRMLAIRAPNDEASGAITMSTFITRITEYSRSWQGVEIVEYGWWALPVGALWLVFNVAMFPIITALHLFAYVLTSISLGLHWPDDALSISRSVESVPLGRHELIVVPPDAKLKGQGLQHGVYSNIHAIRELVSWIRARD